MLHHAVEEVSSVGFDRVRVDVRKRIGILHVKDADMEILKVERI